MNADTQPHRITRGLIGALTREWAATLHTNPDITPWQTQTALADTATLDEVAELASRRGANDEVLAALLRLAHAGDELAARTIVQVMLGAVVRLAARTAHHADGDIEESQARAIAALWAAIRRYPLDRRRRNHADRLSLDVLAAVTHDRRRATLRQPDGTRVVVREFAEGLGYGQLTGEALAVADGSGGGAVAAGSSERFSSAAKSFSVTTLRRLTAVNSDHPMVSSPADGDQSGPRHEFWAQAGHEQVASACSDEQLILLLAWGARHGHVSVDDARLLLRLHSPADPESPCNARQLAEQIGVSHAALRQRVSRATRALTAAVRAAAPAPLDIGGGTNQAITAA